MSSDVINANIQVWRSKVIDGSISQEEMKEAVAAIRKERMGTSTRVGEAKAKTAAAKTTKAKPDGEALLKDLLS